MHDVEGGYVADRGDIAGILIGTIISAGFGIGWILWGTSGRASNAATVVRIVSVCAGLALIVSAVLLLWRSRTDAERGGSGSMFSSPAYRWIVLAEVVALFAGTRVLNATGHGAYALAWSSFVVGVHFLWFGWIFWPGFHVIGGVMVAGALAGVIVYRVGGSAADLRAVTGLIAAADLLLAAGCGVVYSNRQLRR